MGGHPNLVDIWSGLIGRPLVSSVQCHEAKLMDGVAVERRLLSKDYRIKSVDPHGAVVVRDSEGEDLSMQLFFALYSFVELDDAPHRNRHAVSVLSVGDIKRCNATLHFGCGKSRRKRRYCRRC